MALKIASLLLALAVITNGQVNCPGGLADNGFCIYEKKGAVSEDKTYSALGELKSGTLGQQDSQRDNVTDATTERQQSNIVFSLRERLVKDLRDSSESSVVANNEKSKLDSGSSTSDEGSPSDVAHISDEISHSLGTQVKHDDSHDVRPNFGYSGREQDPDRPRPCRHYPAPCSGPELRKSGGPSVSPFSGASPSRSGSLQGSYGGFSPNPSGGPSLGYFTGPSPSPSDDTGPSVFGVPSMATTGGGQSLGSSDGPTARSFGGTKYSYGGPSLSSSLSSSGGPGADSTGGPFTGSGIGRVDDSSQGPPGLLPPGALPGGPSFDPILDSVGGPMQGPGPFSGTFIRVSPNGPSSSGPPGGSFAGPSICPGGGGGPYLGPPPGGPGLGSLGGPGISGQGGYRYDYLSSPGYGIAWQGPPGYSNNYLTSPGYGFAWQWGPGYSNNYISGPGYGFVWHWGPGFSYNYISTPGYGISDQGPGYLYNYNSGPGNSITQQGGPGYPYNYLTSSGSNFVGQLGSGYPQKVSNSPGHDLEGPGYQHKHPSTDGINSQVKIDGVNYKASGFEPQSPTIDTKVSPQVSSTTLPPLHI